MILLLYALIPCALCFLFIYIVVKNTEKKKAKRLSKIPGGINTVNAVQLVSINYHGRIRVHGPGVYVRAEDSDWSSCEIELKFKAAEAGCDIVLEVTKSGSRKEGFLFEGIAYCKG